MLHKLLRNVAQLTVLCICISCSTPLLLGQAVGASLTGQITDPTGAAIPGATVVTRNLETGLKLKATSNGQGVYTLAPLPPGTYSLTVQASGFQRYVQKGIVITVDTATTQNVAMKTGSVRQTVTVTANAQLLNTTSGSLGQTINSHEITQLPLNGRQPSTLIFLSPGVHPQNAGYLQAGDSFPDETGGSANGGHQGSVYFLLDGVPNMDTYQGRAAPFPNADATREFRVITNNFNAAYGFAPGAVVSIETKSGTNNIHGGVWDFYRDQALNAKDWFSHKINPLHRNQYGGDVGGPIFRNKLFYFLNYQGTRSSSASSAAHAYVPTTAMLNGDFSVYSTNGQETMCLNGPSAVCPFGMLNGKPNQLLPGYQLDPVSVEIAKTTLPAAQQPNGFTYFTTPADITDYDEGTGRLDYQPSANQRVFFRSFIRSFVDPGAAIPGNIITGNKSINIRYYNETAGDTWTISPTMVNQFSPFWTELDAGNSAEALTSSGQPFCLSKYINVNELPGVCLIQGFHVLGDGFLSGFNDKSTEARTIWGFYDSLTKTVGKHSLSFGVNLQDQYAREQTTFPTTPILHFEPKYTGQGLSDFLVGDLYLLKQGAGEISQLSGWQLGLYAQDQYRIKPNLTLTLGIRLDPNLPPQIANGRAATFVPGEQSTVYPNAPVGMVFPGDKGIGAGLMRGGWGYWEPRIGLAWQPRGLPHTAFHAGFGLFTSPMIYSQYNHTADNSPFAPTFILQGTSTTPLNFQNPWSGFAGTGGKSPFPPFASASYKPPATATFTPGLSIPATISPGFDLGTTQSWNLTAEQGIGRNMVLKLSYVGSETYHAPYSIDRNPGIYANGGARTTYPMFGAILMMESHGTDNYNGLQVSLNRRMNHNLEFGTNITWSKTIDDATSSNISYGNPELGDPFDLGWSRGISGEDVPFRWISNVIYTVPQPQLHNLFLREALGGWEVSAIITSQSGSPFGVSGGFGNNQSGAGQGGDRADVVPGQSRDVRQGGRSHWLKEYFNINAFKENAPGTFGNSGKNIMFGVPLNYMDMGIDRNFRFMRRYNLQFRWEMFNALNHPSFANPNSGNQITTSGLNKGGSEGEITGTGKEAARIGQLALKFTF